jgi:hypothetical protein
MPKLSRRAPSYGSRHLAMEGPPKGRTRPSESRSTASGQPLEVAIKVVPTAWVDCGWTGGRGKRSGPICPSGERRVQSYFSRLDSPPEVAVKNNGSAHPIVRLHRSGSYAAFRPGRMHHPYGAAQAPRCRRPGHRSRPPRGWQRRTGLDLSRLPWSASLTWRDMARAYCR